MIPPESHSIANIDKWIISLSGDGGEFEKFSFKNSLAPQVLSQGWV